MGNRVRIIASQTHIHLPNGWRFCPISIPMGIIFVPYPYPNRGILYRLASMGPINISNPALARLMRGAGSGEAKANYGWAVRSSGVR
jgi:hypothetical protein